VTDPTRADLARRKTIGRLLAAVDSMDYPEHREQLVRDLGDLLKGQRPRPGTDASAQRIVDWAVRQENGLGQLRFVVDNDVEAFPPAEKAVIALLAALPADSVAQPEEFLSDTLIDLFRGPRVPQIPRHWRRAYCLTALEFPNFPPVDRSVEASALSAYANASPRAACAFLARIARMVADVDRGPDFVAAIHAWSDLVGDRNACRDQIRRDRERIAGQRTDSRVHLLCRINLARSPAEKVYEVAIWPYVDVRDVARPDTTRIGSQRRLCDVSLADLTHRVDTELSGLLRTYTDPVVEMMLPTGELLSRRVDRWQVDGVPLGRRSPVVVRPLEEPAEPGRRSLNERWGRLVAGDSADRFVLTKTDPGDVPRNGEICCVLTYPVDSDGLARELDLGFPVLLCGPGGVSVPGLATGFTIFELPDRVYDERRNEADLVLVWRNPSWVVDSEDNLVWRKVA
jgi:hypothetical protein